MKWKIYQRKKKIDGNVDADKYFSTIRKSAV